MEFKINWIIKNINDLTERKGLLLSSPIFVFDALHNSQWALHLYPYGDNDGNGKFTALYLVRKSDDYPEDIILDCQLSFVDLKPQSFFEFPDSKKKDLASWETTCHTFQKEGRCGSQEFLEKEKIPSFLEQGALTVRCVLSCHQKDVDASMSGGCVAVSQIGKDLRSFGWIIEDFQSLEAGDKKVAPIKTVSKDAHSMTMTLSMTSEKELILDISPIDRKRMKSAFCEMRIKKGTYSTSFAVSAVCFDETKNDEHWIVPVDCNMEEILGLQTNNLLYLECEFEFYLGIEFEKVVYTRYQPVSNEQNDSESCSIL